MGSRKEDVLCIPCGGTFNIRIDSIKRSILHHGIYKCRSCANKKKLFGVGINDADYPTNGCPYYIKWNSMLRRCYGEVTEAYKGVTVCEEWLTLSKFTSWMVTQKWEGLQLDKDILHIGNKLYAPENCCFVSGALNTAMVGIDSKGYITKGNSHTARVKMYGNQVYLGTYSTTEDATNAFRNGKADYIEMLSKDITSPRILAGLKKHIERLQDGEFRK